MTVKYANNAWSYLGANVSAAQTTIIAITGARFPTLAGGDYFYATLVSLTAGFDALGNPLQYEIVKVNGPYVSGATTLNVTRAQDGTAAQMFSAGDLCDLRPCRIALTDLAGVGGALLAANNLSDLASVPTAMNNLGLRIISVRNYGAIGNGVADDTTAINNAYAAIGAGGGVLYFPEGTYKVTGAITTIAKSVTLQGQGRNNTTIITNQLTGTVFTVTAQYVRFADMTITSSVARTANSLVDFQSSSKYGQMSHCTLSAGFINLSTAGTSVDYSNCAFLDPTVTTGVSVYVYGGSDVGFSDCVLTSAAGTQPFAQLRIQICGDVNLTDVSVIRGNTGMLVDPAAGNFVSSINAVNSYFDGASARGVDILPSATGTVARCRFVQCWFNAATANGFRATAGGATVINGIDLIDCQVLGNGADGVSINTSVLNTRIIGGQFAQNVGAGILFNSCTDFSVIGAKCGLTSQFTGNTTYGINIASATCDGFTIANCDLRGNTTAALNNASTVATFTWSVYGNLGDTGLLLQAKTYSADFANATLANIPSFQSNTVNAATTVGARPSGTGVLAQFSVYNNSDLTAALSQGGIRIDASIMRLRSAGTNGGTALPIALDAGGIRFQIDAASGRIRTGAALAADDNIHIFQINGGIKAQTFHPQVGIVTAAAYTALVTDGVLLIDATANSITVTLPAATAAGTAASSTLKFKRIDSTVNTVTIQRAGADLIDGATTTTLTPLQAKTLESDAVTNWYIF